MAKQTSKFFALKRTRGGQMLFVRGRQIGSIYADGAAFNLAMKDWKEFPTFAAAELYAWTHSSEWL